MESRSDFQKIFFEHIILIRMDVDVFLSAKLATKSLTTVYFCPRYSIMT